MPLEHTQSPHNNFLKDDKLENGSMENETVGGAESSTDSLATLPEGGSDSSEPERNEEVRSRLIT